MNKNFEQRMNDLGVDLSLFETASEVVVTKTIKDVEKLKDLLDRGHCEEGRQTRFDNLFGGITRLEEPQDQLLKQVQEYIFGNGKLSPSQLKQANSMFPMNVAMVAAQSKDLDTKWDLTNPDTPIVKVDIETLNLKQGGYIVIHGQSLEFTVDTINRDGNTGSADFADFNILGKNGTKPSPGGTPASPGTAGKGTSSTCAGGATGGVGDEGSPGSDGDPGSPGGKPTPSMAAEIIITKGIGGTENSISIMTMSGAGGEGGKGGDGAKGGKGGKGGDGARCTCEGRPGGMGGIGGRGGNGGPGGDGSDGVDAEGNVTIQIPQAEYSKVKNPIRKEAPPGGRGTGGKGGAGGDGGDAGADVGKGSAPGSSGGEGGEGSKGDFGAEGKKSGKPANVSVTPV